MLNFYVSRAHLPAQAARSDRHQRNDDVWRCKTWIIGTFRCISNHNTKVCIVAHLQSSHLKSFSRPIAQPYPIAQIVRRGLSQVLLEQHLPVGHGGNQWRVGHLLGIWECALQPVVYKRQMYNGYQLLLRLGDDVWLTKDSNMVWSEAAVANGTHPNSNVTISITRFPLLAAGNNHLVKARVKDWNLRSHRRVHMTFNNIKWSLLF